MGSKSRSARGRSRAVRLGFMPECSKIVVFKRHLSYCKTLSRDCLKNSLTRPLERQSTVTHPENRANKARFRYSGSPLGLPLEIFQTVSLGSSVNRGNDNPNLKLYA